MGKRDIHEVRCDLAKKRQPIHDADLERLRALIPAADHPYRGSPSRCFFKLLNCPEFLWPSKGPPARSDVDYLYQCRPLEAVLSEIEPRPDSARPVPPGADKTLNRKKAMQRIEEKLGELRKRGRAWVPLGEIAVGTYGREANSEDNPIRRLINWWTDLALGEDPIIQRIRQVGIPRNWLVGHCVLLRCAVSPEIQDQTRVPTVLDGFASEIFLPRDYAENPTAGQAIDVGVDPFRLGAGEFVLGPIAVEHIELRLTKIPQAENQASAADSDDPSFLARLEQYYRSQL